MGLGGWDGVYYKLRAHSRASNLEDMLVFTLGSERHTI